MNNIQDTSLIALSLIRSGLGLKQRTLWYCYQRNGGLTDREAAAQLGWNPSTVSARRNELIARGSVVDSGQRRDGGKVWRLTPIVASKPEPVEAPAVAQAALALGGHE